MSRYMKMNRASGILMHITSLPGKFGIGSLGPEAYAFADMLEQAGQTYWQILPFNPVCGHFGYSPYASTSTFAGNYYFISLEQLKKFSWVPEHILPHDVFDPYEHFINYHYVTEAANSTLQKVFALFMTESSTEEYNSFHSFCEKHSYWLDDFSLYTALSHHFQSNYWPTWDADIRLRKPDTIKKWQNILDDEITYHKFLQYLFYTQWTEWKAYCNSKGLKIIGDIPIYISIDSADAWGNSDLFLLDETTGEPIAVAGVPPDYFSKTGQRWGNPLYRWLDDSGHVNQKLINWWAKRITHITSLVDVIRIDHFKAFDCYWKIPAAEETAINGEWISVPGKEFFGELKKRVGELPIIAEDLGVITDETEALRDELGLPGMKVLQFAFDSDEKNDYLPHNFTMTNCLVYTGTHDNNTTNGWYYEQEISQKKKEFIKKYLNIEDDKEMHLHFIRLAMSSIADSAIIPLQDVLGYRSEYRMNTPGTLENNWIWKLIPGEITGEHITILFQLTKLYNRLPQDKFTLKDD